MNELSTPIERVLIVGRSPNVLLEAVELLRARRYSANATNHFDHVLQDYDVTDLDIVVFGGMVPPDTKQRLHDEITARNPGVTFIQGIFGIAGVIAAQVQAAATPDDSAAITYDDDTRAILIDLDEATHVTVEAWWATSWTPPEPTSTTMVIWDDHLDAGHHRIPVPDKVPSIASAAAVTLGSMVRVFTIGGMPDAVARMVPSSAGDTRLPEVDSVTTTNDG
ncbi:hypothetical protein [Kribbella sp. C-35]|uniref:hypothetical protein n=1 Tax=Kribbella sp. C-35 TaxID=2789276 RepID=UPI00397C58DB